MSFFPQAGPISAYYALQHMQKPHSLSHMETGPVIRKARKQAAMRAIAIALTLLVLSGCATDMSGEAVSEPLQIPADSRSHLILNFRGGGKATGSADWARLKSAWLTALQSEASTYGLTVFEQAGEIRTGTTPGLLVVIDVSDFLYVTESERATFDLWADDAWVDAEVTYLDARTAKQYGERNYNTLSSDWEAVASAGTDVQLQAIAKDMVAEIRAAMPIQGAAAPSAAPAAAPVAMPPPESAREEGAADEQVSGGDATGDGDDITGGQQKQQQLDQLRRETGLNYEEYQRRYREIVEP